MTTSIVSIGRSACRCAGSSGRLAGAKLDTRSPTRWRVQCYVCRDVTDANRRRETGAASSSTPARPSGTARHSRQWRCRNKLHCRQRRFTGWISDDDVDHSRQLRRQRAVLVSAEISSLLLVQRRGSHIDAHLPRYGIHKQLELRPSWAGLCDISAICL